MTKYMNAQGPLSEGAPKEKKPDQPKSLEDELDAILASMSNLPEEERYECTQDCQNSLVLTICRYMKAKALELYR